MTTTTNRPCSPATAEARISELAARLESYRYMAHDKLVELASRALAAAVAAKNGIDAGKDGWIAGMMKIPGIR